MNPLKFIASAPGLLMAAWLLISCGQGSPLAAKNAMNAPVSAYPPGIKDSVMYQVRFYSQTDDMWVDEYTFVNVAVLKVSADSLWVGAKLAYKTNSQNYQGKTIEYNSGKSVEYMTADEKYIHNKAGDLLQKNIEATIDKEGNIFIDRKKYMRGRIREELWLNFLFVGLPPLPVQPGVKWQKVFTEETIEKNVKLELSVTKVDQATIYADAAYRSSFVGGGGTCTGNGVYYLNSKTLLVDSFNLDIRIMPGVVYNIHTNIQAAE